MGPEQILAVNLPASATAMQPSPDPPKISSMWITKYEGLLLHHQLATLVLLPGQCKPRQQSQCRTHRSAQLCCLGAAQVYPPQF